MGYLKSYRSFINSQHVYEGIRVSVGILIPALLMAYFGLLQSGIVLSLGAMCVSVTDSPGPILHRRNGMLACILSIFVVSVFTSYAAVSAVTMGFVLIVMCFFFSMLAIYGARAGAVGIAALLILVLEIDKHRQGWEVWVHALYLAMGGLWYLCLSVLLYNVRPYKLPQQTLGDSIQSIAEYLRLRADFYNKEVDYDITYRRLLQQQALVQEKQNMLGELLFKTRDIIKESTPTGRILVMIYMDIADMFERITTSYQNYETLHDHFDGLNILQHFNALALELANEIETIGIAIKSGVPSGHDAGSNLSFRINETRKRLDALRETHLSNDNISGFMSLRRILENIEDLSDRVKTLHQYTTFNPSFTTKASHQIDYGKYISHQDISTDLFINNLTFKSEIFSHSLRLSITVLLGYLVSLFFPVGHGYWILLTIVVILKPAYSLTKSRNKDRLMGTVLGVLLGLIILFLVDDKTALLFIMILLMVGTYTFLRKHYFTSVALMTPYIIIFFHLLNPNSFKDLLADRLIDTAIGSAIAYATSLLLFPAWEREKIKPIMDAMLNEATTYFNIIAEELTGATNFSARQVARKNANVALANLSDAFNRMLAEPKRKQQGIKEIHHFVVLSHMLLSHIATLSFFGQKNVNAYNTPAYFAVAGNISLSLDNAKAILNADPSVKEEASIQKDALRKLNEHADLLVHKRQEEIKESFADTETKKELVVVKSVVDQFNFIYNIAVDFNKTAKAVVSIV